MHTIHGIYDGKTIQPLEPVRAHPNARVIITFIGQESGSDLPVTRIEDVAGCLHYTGPAKTLAEMESAIRKGIEEQWR